MRFPRRAALALVLLAACKEAPPPREFDGTAAFGYVEQQMAFGPRVPARPGTSA